MVKDLAITFEKSHLLEVLFQTASNLKVHIPFAGPADGIPLFGRQTYSHIVS